MENKNKIDRATVDKLRGALDAVLMRYYAVDGRGRKKYTAVCPWHGGKGDLYVDAEKGVCNCFSCGLGYDAVGIVAKEERLDERRDFTKILRIIAEITHTPLIEADRQRQAPTPRRTTVCRQRPQLAPVSISPRMLHTYAQRWRDSALAQWLLRYFSPIDVETVMRRYLIGASNHYPGAVVLPYVGADGICIDAKIMAYDPMTGRRKTAAPLYVRQDGTPAHQTFALAVMLSQWIKQGKYPAGTDTSDIRRPWRAFGSHLLALYPDAPVAVVESEKSALICSMAWPDYVWLAVGGKSYLTAERLSDCRGRKIVLYPDRYSYADVTKCGNVIKGWITLGRELADRGYNVSVAQWADAYPPRPDGTGEDDIADIILRGIEAERTGVEYNPQPTHSAPTATPPPDVVEAMTVWQSMLAKLDADTRKLVDGLQLRPISTRVLTPIAV